MCMVMSLAALWSQKVFCELIATRDFVQHKQSLSHRVVLRGLHYQESTLQQGKPVRILTGRVFDVLIDIRQTSETYGQHIAVELTAENNRMFWIAEGFAHDFLALEDNTTFTYETTDYYNKATEFSIHWTSPALNIRWLNFEKITANEKIN